MDSNSLKKAFGELLGAKRHDAPSWVLEDMAGLASPGSASANSVHRLTSFETQLSFTEFIFFKTNTNLKRTADSRKYL